MRNLFAPATMEDDSIIIEVDSRSSGPTTKGPSGLAGQVLALVQRGLTVTAVARELGMPTQLVEVVLQQLRHWGWIAADPSSAGHCAEGACSRKAGSNRVNEPILIDLQSINGNAMVDKISARTNSLADMPAMCRGCPLA